MFILIFKYNLTKMNSVETSRYIIIVILVILKAKPVFKALFNRSIQTAFCIILTYVFFIVLLFLYI